MEKILIPTYNKGGYKIKIIEINSKTNPINLKITGKVFDATNGKILSNAQLVIGCFKIQNSSQGEYTFKTNNLKNDFFYIEAIFTGYKTIQTDFIDLTNKNEIQIDFYLAEDDRPFINCEDKTQAF
ncbi:hypothetical protein ACM55M_02545 [Flavobacterium sp. ZT3R25]